MTRIVILASLLTASLVASYLTWTQEETDQSQTSIALYSAKQDDLESLTWTSEEATVIASRRKDALGDYTWIELTERKKPKPKKKPEPPEGGADPAAEGKTPPEGETPPADGQAAEAPPEEEAGPVEETRIAFLANEKGEELWSNFAPLMAMRELNLPAGFDQKTLGFEKPSAKVTVQRKSGPLELTVGAETYGGKDLYLRKDQTTYLVDDALLSTLKLAGTRLIERRLFTQGEDKADQVSIEKDGKQRTWTQKNKDDRAKASWVNDQSPDAADDAGALWLGKLFRMRLANYVEEGKAPALTPVFQFRVEGEGKSWEIQVFRGEDNEFYAKSNFNRSLVKLTRSLASETIEDIDELLAGA